MNLKNAVYLLTTSIFLLFAPLSLLAESQENSLLQAIKLFDQNKFKEAETILSELIKEHPEDLMINYYYGACRTENQEYGQNEILYLLKGSTGESPLKTDYYLAVQYHAQNRWDDALLYYKTYENTCSPDEAKELDLAEKIRLCSEKVNPFVNDTTETSDIAPAAIVRPARENESVSANAVYPEAEQTSEMTPVIAEDDSSGIAIEESVPEVVSEEVPETEETEPINFFVNNDLTYVDISNFRTEEGLEAYQKWESSRQSLDSLNTTLNSFRSDYARAQKAEKRNELGQKIIAAEGELLPLQRKTNDLLNEVRRAENDYWNEASTDEYDDFVEHLHKMHTSIQNQAAEVPPIDTNFIVSEVFDDIVPATPVTKEETGDELVYKIQIGAYSRGLPPYVKKQFDKLGYIRKIENYTDDRGVVVYTTGNLTKLEDAVKMQNQVRQEGIEDAFVVPYFNGKRITLGEAKKIESER